MGALDDAPSHLIKAAEFLAAASAVGELVGVLAVALTTRHHLYYVCSVWRFIVRRGVMGSVMPTSCMQSVMSWSCMMSVTMTRRAGHCCSASIGQGTCWS